VIAQIDCDEAVALRYDCFTLRLPNAVVGEQAVYKKNRISLPLILVCQLEGGDGQLLDRWLTCFVCLRKRLAS
jgi:hypothetical protein